MLKRLVKTAPGRALHEFLRTKRGRDLDKAMVRLFGGSLLVKIHSRLYDVPEVPILMLYAIGRKTGQERSSVLPYTEVDGVRYLVASRGGQEKNPQWAENLRATPSARIEVGGRIIPVSARTLADNDPQRARVWERVSIESPTTVRYQTLTSRKFPIIALEEVR